MAATRIDQYSASVNPQFIYRTQASIVNAAQAITAEATGTANHVNRVALAKQVCLNPGSWAQIFAMMLAAQAVDQTSTDAAIDAMVSSVWNAVAGVV